MTTATRRGLTAITAALVVLGLSGCASETTSTQAPQKSAEASREAPDESLADPLQSYIEASQPAVEAELDRYADIYSDFSIEAEGPRTLVFRYTFRNEVDAAQAQSNIASTNETLKALANESIFPEMKAAGIEDPEIKWIFQNPDGSVVASVEVAD